MSAGLNSVAMPKDKTSVSYGDVTVFLGRMVKPLPVWREACQELAGFRYLLVEANTRNVVAATIATDRSHLLRTYHDHCANDSSLALDVVDGCDFFIAPGPVTSISTVTGQAQTVFVER